MKHPRWEQLVRRHLPELDCSAEHESEIVEELAQLLEDASRDQDFDSQAALETWLQREIPQWTELARHAVAEKEPERPLPRFVAPSSRARIFDGIFTRHLRHALRRLAQKPGFTATAVLSLGIGIGANAAIFSFVHALLDHDHALEAPEELVNIYTSMPGLSSSPLSQPDYRDIRDNTQDVFEGVAVSTPVFAVVDRDGSPASVMGEAVSGNYFDLLGIEAELGRTFSSEDDVSEGGHYVVVLGHGYWQAVLGGDPAVLGTEIRISGQAYTVVGVASADYSGNLYGVLDTDFFAPAGMYAELQGARDRDTRDFRIGSVKARLRPGVSLMAAQGVVDSIGAHLREAQTEGWDEQGEFVLVPSGDVLVLPMMDPYLRATGWMLTIGVAVVLLMACMNLASFLLAEAIDRRKEIAVRLALGASRRHLVGQLLSENVVLALCGGTLGLGLAVGLLRWAASTDIRFGPTLPIRVDVGVDLTVLGVTGNLQLSGFMFQYIEFDIDEMPPPVRRDRHLADHAAVDRGFFDATGIRILDGRNFDAHDTKDGLPVTIISESMAQRFWPGQSAIGRQIRNPTFAFSDNHDDLTVVGIASDTKVRSLDEPYRSYIYRPFSQSYYPMMSLVARTSVDPETLLPEIQAAARGADPELWQLDLTTMKRHLDIVLLPRRLSASALSMMATLALALSAIGLNGAVRYAVSSRTREIGIRMSLGADRQTVLRLLMATGMTPLLVGTGVGLALALALGRLMTGLLVGVSSYDPVTFVGGGSFILVIAMLSAWLPSRRASRIDPVTALRSD